MARNKYCAWICYVGRIIFKTGKAAIVCVPKQYIMKLYRRTCKLGFIHPRVQDWIRVTVKQHTKYSVLSHHCQLDRRWGRLHECFGHDEEKTPIAMLLVF